ncbi:MAG: tandem-95 repeat protein [Methylococcaceae bacterium]
MSANTAYSSGVFYFTPTKNYNGTTSFDFTATDLAGNSVLVTTSTITVNAVNDAPVLANTIPTIIQVAGAPTPVSNRDSVIGTLVSSLVSSSNVTDVDGTGLGIAITAVDSTQGNWWYTTNNGTNWTLVNPVTTPATPVVSATNALFLAADTNTRLYFDPTSTGTFSITAGATFKAWDQTDSLANGSKHTTFVSGSSGSFIGSVSSNNANAPVSVVNADLLDTVALDDFSSVIRAGTEAAKNYKVRGNTTASNFTDFDDSDTSKPTHHRYDQESGASQSVTKYVDRYAVNTTDANHILKNTDTTTFDHNEYKIGSYGTLYLKDGSSTTAASYVYVPDDAAVNALNAGFYTETFGVKHYTSYSNKAFSGYAKTDTVTFTIVGVNDAPIFTSLTSSVAAGNEDNQISVSFIDLTTQGNESDVDGSVAAFTVKAVSTGTLKIGTSANSAADFSITNNTIDSTHFAYWTPDTNANGTLNAFTVVAKDSNGLESSTAAVQAQIAVAAVNDVPSFTKSSNQTIDEDAGAQTVSGWAASLSKGGGSDETNQTLSFIVTNDNSQLFSVAPSVDNTGKLTYTPAANANGSATVSVQIHDTGGTTIGGIDTSAAQTFAITVNPVNDAPTFTSFSEAVATGNEDTQISVTMGDLSGKGNENDVDGLDTVTAFIVKALTSGTLKIGANSASATAWNATTNKTIDATHIAYWTPAANANGTLDAFTVVAKDDGGLESSTPVQAQIAVTAVNDLPQFTDSSHITLTDTSASDTFVNQTGQLTATDVDTGSTQTYGATSSSPVSFTSGGKTYDLAVTGDYGVLHVKSTSGDYVYVPDSSVINAISLNSNPVDSFTVSVSDGFDSPVTKPLTVSITGANDTPIILQPFAAIGIADTANQLENFSSIVGDVSATDAESSTLTYSIETSPVSGASYGVLTIDSSTGQYTFNPDEAKINGLLETDTLVQSVYTLKVADTQGGFVTQNLTVNITGANDDPTLTVDATALTVTDTALPDDFSALTGSLKGSAPDSGVTYSVTGGTTDTSNLDLISKTTDFGTLTVSKSAGTFSFLPNPVKVNSLKADLNGVSDEFVVQTISNSGTHVTKTLTYNFVGANDNPLLTGSLATLAHGTEDTAYNISASDLLTGYTDVDSTPLSVLDLHATNGDITVSGSNFIFTPHPNFNGTVGLTYTVNDNDSGSVNAAQYFVLNAVNDAPIATDNLFVIDEDNSHTFSSGSAVTDFGYSDIESDAMVGIKITSIPDVSEGVLKLGTATLANGAEIAQADISNLKFVPASNFNGTAKFDFKVADNGGYSKDAQTITFTVNAVNDAPTAANNTITLDEDSTHIFSIGDFRYSDVENSPISSITIGTLPSAGVLAFYNSTNVIHAGDTIDSGSIEHLTFAPALNENGATYADFTFTVNDGTIESSSANTISLAVAPVNDAPTFTTLSSAVKTGNANSAITVNFADLTSEGNEADIDGTVDAFVVKALSSGTLKIGTDAAFATDFASGNNTIDATHIAYWTPAFDVKGNNLSAFTVVAKDNGGLESSLPAVQAVVNVLAVNTPGVASISGTPTQGQVLTASVIDANGLQGVNPNFQWKSGGASGTNISGATASTYTLRQSDVGKKIAVAVTYTDNDGFAENDTSEIANNVANINDLGRITISGTAAQGQVLTSALVDDDGLVGVTSVYQWKAGGIIISGATASTYTLTQAEVGKAITVQATYTDNGHTAEAPVSAPTSLVTSIEVNGGTTNVNNNTPHTYIATPGNEIITGTSRSDDTVTYVNSTSAVTVSLAITKSQDTGGSGFDTITKIENLTGSNFDDTLTGSAKANIKNVIDGGTGADTMAGGTGDDTYYVDNVGDVVTEVTKQGVDTVISTVDYSLASLPYVENLTLSGTVLNATGNSYANKIIGNASDNVIVGGAGNDSLNGGLGNDSLTGGLGNDHFQLTTAIGSTNIDTITDFAKGDKIDLSKSIFTSLSGSRLATSNFGVDKYISYDKTTGVLSYDADATGSGLPVQIAVIGTTTHPTLSATDFGIIA